MSFGIGNVPHCLAQLNQGLVYEASFDLVEGGKYLIVVFVPPFKTKPVLRVYSFFFIVFQISHISDGKICCDGATESGIIKACSFVSVGAYHDAMVISLVRIVSKDQKLFFEIYRPAVQNDTAVLWVTV